MPTRKTGEKNVRKLIKLGQNKGSLAVTIPRKIIDKYGWKEKQKVVVEDKGRGIIVLRDWRSKK